MAREVVSEGKGGEYAALERKKNRRLRKRRTGRIVFLIFLASAALVLTGLYAPFFNIKEVYCVGLEGDRAGQVIGASRISLGTNIFRFDMEQVKRDVADVAYVEQSNVKREFPNRVKIWVREGVAAALIESGADSFFCISGSGRILEIVSAGEQPNVPILRGFEIDGFRPGQNIGVKEEKKFELGIACVNEIVHNGFIDKIKSIDITNIEDISLNFEDRILVKLGHGGKISYRMGFLRKILDEQIPDNATGILEFTADDKVVFR